MLLSDRFARSCQGYLPGVTQLGKASNYRSKDQKDLTRNRQTAFARQAQARIATSYRCSACGTDVDLGSKFSAKGGAALRR